MKEIKVLLICGGGFSSGFMAKALREAALKMDINLDAQARSESMIEDYIEDVDAVMVGPHLSYEMEDIGATCEDYDVVPVLMKPDYYKSLDGKAAVEHLLECLREAGKYE